MQICESAERTDRSRVAMDTLCGNFRTRPLAKGPRPPCHTRRRINRVPSSAWARPSSLCYSLVLCCCSFLVLRTVHAYPINRKTVSNNDLSGAVTYLTKFGYLPASDIETGNLRTEAQLKEAIKVMQRFGNIPETGELDERTLKLMKKKRCGNPDDPHKEYLLPDRTKRYALQGVKWPKVDLTWSLNEITTSLSKDSIRYEIGQAFKFWSDASKLTFTEVQADANADIKVSFYSRYHGDGYPFDGQGAILAHAFFPGDGRGGDTHFDKEERWIAGIENSNEGVSLLSVAAHEFGHSLGLSHSSVPDALMFPYYQGLKNNFQLPYDDTMGIQQLYGGKEERPWAPLPPAATQPPYVAPPTTTTRGTPASTPRRPPKKAPQTPTKGVILDKPDTCDTDYDAISVIRHEIFIFKNKYFWRLDDTRNLDMNYPVEIERFWYNLPTDLKHVDALYERLDKKIVFFIGQQYWIFDANHPLPGYPKPLSHLGLPDDIKKLDAAMVWGHNKKTYFFSGTMYWKFDEERQLVELDYPRDISNVWEGVPYNIDAAFQSSSGDTYFFKGKAFWKFNDARMRVENKAPSLSGPFWMGCPDKTVYPNAPEEDREDVAATNRYTEEVLPVKGSSGASRPGAALLGLLLFLSTVRASLP